MKTVFKFLVVTSFLSLFLAGCNKRVQSKSSTHPLKISEGGLILVKVLVSDSIEGRFILDTGAGIHAISDGLRRRLSSLPAGNFTGFRHTGERVDFGLFQIPSLSIAGFRQEKPLAASWSLLDSFKIDGILSLKFFESCPFTLDFRDTILVFETRQTLADRIKKSQRVPIRLHDDRAKSLDLFVDVQAADSQKLECILDTGSPSSVLDARFMPTFDIDSTSKEVQKRTRKSLFGAVETEYIATVPSISLWNVPSATAKNFRVTFKPHLIYDGLLGTDFLLGRRLTFNIPEKYILVGTD